MTVTTPSSRSRSMPQCRHFNHRLPQWPFHINREVLEESLNLEVNSMWTSDRNSLCLPMSLMKINLNLSKCRWSWTSVTTKMIPKLAEHFRDSVVNLTSNFYYRKQIQFRASEKWTCSSNKNAGKQLFLKIIVMSLQKRIGKFAIPSYKWCKSNEIKIY